MEQNNESSFKIFETPTQKFTLGWKEIGALVFGFIVGQMLVAGIGLIMIFGLHQSYENSPGFLIIAYVFSMIFPILAFDFFIERPKGRKLNFNFQTKPFYTYFLSFGMMIGMMLVAEYLVSLIPISGKFFGPIYEQFSEQINSLSLDNVAMIIMTSIFAPILEEIVFRGIIMKGMLNKGVKPVNAILLSAFIFGAIHGYPWQFVGAFLLGTVLGLVYYKTKSLLLPILLHAFNNLISSLLIIYTKSESFAESLNMPEVYLFIFGMIIFITFYYLFMRKYRVHFIEN